MTAQSREFDIIVWGATGFTGKLVAKYLHERQRHTGASWAIAGRSESKLQAIKDELGLGEQVPILLADSHDRASLDALVKRAKVICTTVGPYALYGSELVAACVEHGTDYCDLTGEVHWVRRMIDAHHERAQQTGARVVHFCGFDSIPSDLGTLMLQRAALEQHGRPCSRVTYYMMRASGGFSGGTIASMVNSVELFAREPELRRIVGDPYALNPPSARKGPDGKDALSPAYDQTLGAWTGPFVMAPVNTRVVRRSNALLDDLYGRDFRYQEVTRTGSGPSGALKAGAFTGGLTAFFAALSVPALRSLLVRHVLPKPGQGPSPEAIERGFFEVLLIGQLPGGATMRARVGASKDPGYGATAIMLSEAALGLALDKPLSRRGGVLTPASALGMPLVDRLRRAGMTFTLER